MGYLPTIRVTGMTNPVVQVMDEDTGEIVSTLRIGGVEFRPTVFKHGQYTIQVREPGTKRVEVLRDLPSLAHLRQ